MDDERLIPQILHSEYEECPFSGCTMCGEALRDVDEGFQISKVFRRGECVFEYALCMPCRDRMAEDFSEDSVAAMEKFHEENIEAGHGLEECACCHRESKEWPQAEYSLVAACLHDALLDGIMVCIDCTEAMQGLLSKQTKDRRDRFIEENFPCAPDETAPVPSGVGML